MSDDTRIKGAFGSGRNRIFLLHDMSKPVDTFGRMREARNYVVRLP